MANESFKSQKIRATNIPLYVVLALADDWELWLKTTNRFRGPARRFQSLFRYYLFWEFYCVTVSILNSGNMSIRQHAKAFIQPRRISKC